MNCVWVGLVLSDRSGEGVLTAIGLSLAPSRYTVLSICFLLSSDQNPGVGIKAGPTKCTGAIFALVKFKLCIIHPFTLRPLHLSIHPLFTGSIYIYIYLSVSMSTCQTLCHIARSSISLFETVTYSIKINCLGTASHVKFYLYVYMCIYIVPPLWSSGQSSWLQIRRPGFDSRHYQKKK
jgi:hypothetical protein